MTNNTTTGMLTLCLLAFLKNIKITPLRLLSLACVRMSPFVKSTPSIQEDLGFSIVVFLFYARTIRDTNNLGIAKGGCPNGHCQRRVSKWALPEEGVQMGIARGGCPNGHCQRRVSKWALPEEVWALPKGGVQMGIARGGGGGGGTIQRMGYCRSIASMLRKL